MRITVLGTGYVGLVVAACLADSGNDVIGVDNDIDKVAQLQSGHSPIYEPGLEELLERNIREGRLRFTTDLSEAVRRSEIIFIAVGTPSNPDGSVDLSQVFAVAEGIAHAMNGPKIIVIKSTVPVGTAEQVQQIIARSTPYQFDIVSNPEFLKEGAALNDFLKPDRIIIGTSSSKAAEVMKELYAPFVRTEKPIILMDNRSAEMTKYASNLMLATKISVMNELANLCERVGADIEQVRKGVGADSRIGYAFIFPGVGYGGSCFPKDIKALIHLGRQLECPLHIAEAVEAVNHEQRLRFLEKIYKHFRRDLHGRRITVWGLAFKPGTDDMREAPSITIIQHLLSQGATITAHDPKANGTARAIFGDQISYAEDLYASLQGAEALVLITEWNEFRNPDFERMKQVMHSPVIFDGRNIYNPVKLRQLGFTYYGVGRP
ncbi:MAG: UDP-glucose/GDP-mannose dehydrogenase family protein [Candidatus Bipolaricaulota bacterium]|nr:UDP-glucose/GDP-mannose dehydrogenase family protein [Candidatus Bipolaricaulota bacterium]MDW8030969.1 UDP-glucose/GDP-mannose dehydrogenase family protein [Candidatus Bipolaricaulota bacterium]